MMNSLRWQNTECMKLWHKLARLILNTCTAQEGGHGTSHGGPVTAHGKSGYTIPATNKND